MLSVWNFEHGAVIRWTHIITVKNHINSLLRTLTLVNLSVMQPWMIGRDNFNENDIGFGRSLDVGIDAGNGATARRNSHNSRRSGPDSRRWIAWPWYSVRLWRLLACAPPQQSGLIFQIGSISIPKGRLMAAFAFLVASVSLASVRP